MKRSKTYFLFIFLIIMALSSSGKAQTSISGIINQYAKCISFLANSNSVVVDNATFFHKNDTVLIIQMMGAEIDLSNTNNFGNIINLNNTGVFEFNMVDSVHVPSNTVYLKCTLINNYTGPSQIVRVPAYNNAQVDGLLTAKAWDGSSGGVLTFIDNGTIKLNADIDVSGKGFRGAVPTFNPNNLCATTSTGFLSYSYTINAIDSAGLKGEGITIPNQFYARGRGNYATGGGGGHTYDAAGGGGSCYGNGGKGGTVADTCGFINDMGGFGGLALSSQVSGQLKVFLGGGGGAGLYESNTLNDATSGGSGGGIIIIAASGGIVGNNKNIIANGNNVTGTAINESAGGGGGGGSIVIISQNVTGLLSVQAKGGNGGATSGSCRGSGGGGGGGLLVLPSIIPGTISFVNGGFPGGVNVSGSCSQWMGTSGNNGHIINNLNIPVPACFAALPIVNNFISGNQFVCQNSIPSAINGTTPQGGNGTYSYNWEYSFDGINWIPDPGATAVSYTFSAPITQTIHFRRIVNSDIETSVSNELIISLITIDVNITSDPVSCFGLCDGNANATVTGTTGLQYSWSNGLTSPSVSGLCEGFYAVTATHTASGCIDTASVYISQPSALSSTISSFINPTCHNTSDGSATVTVTGGVSPYYHIWTGGQTSQTASGLPAGSYSVIVTDFNNCVTSSSVVLSSITNITDNIIDEYKIICGTDTTFPILGNIPGGVDTSTVGYFWIQTNDTTTSAWTTASTLISGINGQIYFPPNPGSITMFYSRIVLFNGCVDTSNICVVYVYPGSTSLSDNIITPVTQSVNYSQIPSAIGGNIITGGISGDTLKYLWFKSVNSTLDPMFIATEGTYQDTNFVFVEGADTSFYYSRFAYYTLYNNSKLACVSVSNVSRVLLVDSNNISCADTVLCSGTSPSIIIGNTGTNYTYQWQVYDGSGWIDIPGITTPDFQPTISSLIGGNNTRFRRVVIIGGTTTIISNVITIHVIPVITNNVIWTGPPYPSSLTGIYVCPGSVVGMGTNPSSPIGGGNGNYTFQWFAGNNTTSMNPITFLGTYEDYQTPAIWDTMYFVRQVRSATCISQSNIIEIIPVPPLPANVIYIPNDSICFGSNPDQIVESSSSVGLGLNYSWEYMSASSGGWTTLSGITSANYQPGNLSETTSYRRTIANNQASPSCVSQSNEITIYVVSPSYNLSVPPSLDTVPNGSGSTIVVDLIGDPTFNFDLWDGMNNIHVAADTSPKSIPVIPYQNPTNYTVQNLVDGKGCNYNGSGQIASVYTYYSENIIAGNDTDYCGNSGNLNASYSTNGFNWWTGPPNVSFADTNNASTLITVIIPTPSNYFQIYWHVQDGLFHDSISISVKFWEMPYPPFAGSDITLVGQNSTQLNADYAQPGTTIGNWSVLSGYAEFNNIEDPHAFVNSLPDGESVLLWTVTNGPVCDTLSDTLMIFVTDLLIPEGFSPNNDGKNDVFEITGIQVYDMSELVVFNRWGNMIYNSSKDNNTKYHNDWNGYGTNGKPLPEDTYFYILTINNKEFKKGYLVLKR